MWLFARRAPRREQLLLLLGGWTGAQRARIGSRRRWRRPGPGLRVGELAGDPDAALELAGKPREDRLDRVVDRPERQARRLGARVAPAMKHGEFAGRGDPDWECALAPHPVLLEPRRRD